MDKRYQVFVSSTYEDLREERQEVMQALLELDCMPAGMELFPAANDDQWTLIKRVIDDCDYYIVVVGGRYGSVGRGGLGYTEMEYEYAIAQGKPVIGFLHKEPGTLPANKCEKTDEGRKKLQAFREHVQEKMCRYWTSPSELGSVVSRSLVKLIKSTPAIGWVRADLLPDKTSADEILRLKREIDDLQQQLEKNTSPAGTEHLSQGEDIIQLRYTFGAYKTGSFRAEGEYEATFVTTWNAVFAIVSPLLIDEASDSQMKQAIDQFIDDQNAAEIKKDKKFKDLQLRRFSINGEDFNTIKVQLLALRLISRSLKKKTRSVGDRNAYWALTPYGETVMIGLRAIPKDGKPRTS